MKVDLRRYQQARTTEDSSWLDHVLQTWNSWHHMSQPYWTSRPLDVSNYSFQWGETLAGQMETMGAVVQGICWVPIRLRGIYQCPMETLNYLERERLISTSSVSWIFTRHVASFPNELSSNCMYSSWEPLIFMRIKGVGGVGEQWHRWQITYSKVTRGT